MKVITMPSNLLIELKRRFKSPVEALKALGLDEKTIKTLAMDEKMPETAEELLSKLREMVVNLPPDEHDALVDGLREIVDSGDPAQWANSTGEDEPTDQPPIFPGRPERAEDRRRLAQDRAMDRAARAYDAAHPEAAAQARAAADFYKRFPKIKPVERV
jgi:hypothetical protein